MGEVKQMGAASRCVSVCPSAYVYDVEKRMATLKRH